MSLIQFSAVDSNDVWEEIGRSTIEISRDGGSVRDLAASKNSGEVFLLAEKEMIKANFA